jgi:hypothetical protein
LAFIYAKPDGSGFEDFSRKVNELFLVRSSFASSAFAIIPKLQSLIKAPVQIEWEANAAACQMAFRVNLQQEASRDKVPAPHSTLSRSNESSSSKAS